MSSLDSNNIVEDTTIVSDNTSNTLTGEAKSINSLTGHSNIMFVLLDSDDEIESVFCTIVDFDDQSFRVKQVSGDSYIAHNKTSQSVNDIYEKDYIDGLEKMFYNQWNISIEKYVVFNYNDLKQFFSWFNGVTVNVSKDINYNSSEYNLELNKGKQVLSGEKALNYLLACENSAKESVICDIISSILKPEYVDNAYTLFKEFVNSSKTNISVIDYSESIDTLKTYCYAKDRFAVTPYNEGDCK